MRTLTIDDKLYSYLQERSEETGRPIDELATDAIKLWLLGLKTSKAELSKKVPAERDSQTTESEMPPIGEPYSSFHVMRNMNLDGPPDWSTRLEDYLYGKSCGDPDETELAEIEVAEREYQEKGGMEAGEFFRSLRKERGWE